MCKNAGVTVTFVPGSNEIDTNGRGALAGVATWLQNGDQRTVRLEGYTDKAGGATANQKLSERRAQAAKDFLLSRGIEPDRIMVFGHGEQDMLTGAEARVVVVTACDVPPELAAETPPPLPPAPEPAPRRRGARTGARAGADRRGGATAPAAARADCRAGHRRPTSDGGQSATSRPPGWASRPRSVAARSDSSTKARATSPTPAPPGMRA